MNGVLTALSPSIKIDKRRVVTTQDVVQEQTATIDPVVAQRKVRVERKEINTETTKVFERPSKVKTTRTVVEGDGSSVTSTRVEVEPAVKVEERVIEVEPETRAEVETKLVN